MFLFYGLIISHVLHTAKKKKKRSKTEVTSYQIKLSSSRSITVFCTLMYFSLGNICLGYLYSYILFVFWSIVCSKWPGDQFL